MGFSFGSERVRIRRRVKRNGTWTRETVYLLSSHTLDQLEATGMLQMKRDYWTVESRLHHCLDITMKEDHSRVRNPNAARVLEMTRRIALSLANDCIDRARKLNAKTKANTKRFYQAYRSRKGGEERLQALIFAKQPTLTTL